MSLSTYSSSTHMAHGSSRDIHVDLFTTHKNDEMWRASYWESTNICRITQEQRELVRANNFSLCILTWRVAATVKCSAIGDC